MDPISSQNEWYAAKIAQLIQDAQSNDLPEIEM